MPPAHAISSTFPDRDKPIGERVAAVETRVQVHSEQIGDLQESVGKIQTEISRGVFKLLIGMLLLTLGWLADIVLTRVGLLGHGG